MEKLQYFVNGEFRDSKTEVWYDLHNPSTGESRIVAMSFCVPRS